MKVNDIGDPNKVVMIVDASVMRDMIEGKNEGKAKEILDLLDKITDEDKRPQMIAPLSSFLRAIYLSKGGDVRNIQRIIDHIQIFPSFAHFKDEDAVMKELIKIAEIMSGRKRNEKEN